LRASELEQLHVERPEANPVIEVPQMCELVAERAHEAGVEQRLPGDRVVESDLDHAIVVADAVAAGDIGPLGLDRSVTKAEAVGDLLSVPIEPRDQIARGCAIRSIPTLLHAPELSVARCARQEPARAGLCLTNAGDVFVRECAPSTQTGSSRRAGTTSF